VVGLRGALEEADPGVAGEMEFRYAVAGCLGLSEVLRRLDSIEESNKKLWESQSRLLENANKLWEEVKALREG